MMPELRHFGKYFRNTREVLKCGAGDGWRRSVGLIMWEMKCYKETRRPGISYIQ
jgi:hypothetical protein